MKENTTLHTSSFGTDEQTSYRQSHGLLHLIRLHPLVSFFVMAYGFSWLGWLPYILSLDGLGLLPFHSSSLIVAPGAYLGPLLSGFLMTAIMDGRSGIRQFLRRFLLWRVKWYWYLFIFLAIPVLRVVGLLGIDNVLSTYLPGSLQGAPLIYVMYLPLTILVSGLAEEPGWRGFALPRMQQKLGPVLGTLLLGVLWGVWHLPLFVTGWAAGNSAFTIASFFGSTVALAVIFTWVFNHTRGSLLIAILMHGAIDAFGASLLFSHPLAATPLPVMMGFGTLALILIAVTRGRLGYRSYIAQRD